MNQHEVRRFALQVIFLLNQNQELTAQSAIQQVKNTTDFDQETPEYATYLVNGVEEKRADLRQSIAQYLKQGWKIERINKIDLSILELAIFEIQNSESIPKIAAVDEALNLAGEFSDDVSKAFINGILSNFVSK
ncbi:hypothetical protein FC62_GL000032 [Amylolactobacillus amylotrophicus DSM 20534]|uniref:Transcription antitermination protein NusB n=3 Tax=Amylolactobacillus TaxID=2767876 RepID=A0A0R1YLM1_9LACO|nr:MULTISPECIES: transcription antitermination factor NusB [Amylolactobacillus]APT17939.1 hypothetical protein LA20533_00755 [Amylolactobacillus amylophilus DSM 20533 = JCM 1125]KRK38350.1 hypothetical protein FC62_GL000032 [Amylolactobacillus amylotrophicus DSM 20534]KRM43007.1 hypothetical protein FD40_GL000807 [Amylolactobacillus amylophilus DSM 20533 = JCM 1125]GED79876.1 N utilization substance protein B [Amylolactobacillus amylophilus]